MIEVTEIIMKQLIMPHIALTVYKGKAKVTAYIKSLKMDVTIDQLGILKLISLRPNISQQELASSIFKDKSNLSRIIETLEKKGLVKRHLDIKSNRAVKKITLTPKGKEYANKFSEIAGTIQEKLIAGISEKDLEIMKSALEKIRKNMDNLQGDII